MIECAGFDFFLSFLRYGKAMNLKRLLYVTCHGSKGLCFLPCEAPKVDLFNSDWAIVTIVETLEQGERRDETG
jgi:hypothetical protein